jgi:hypothetical protein
VSATALVSGKPRPPETFPPEILPTSRWKIYVGGRKVYKKGNTQPQETTSFVSMMKFGSSSTSEKSTNPCSCGLSLEKVLDLDSQKIVQLKQGFCQNPRADTSHGICGMPLGAHRSNGDCF